MCYYRTDDGKCNKYSDDTNTSYCVDGPCPDDMPTNADRIRGMSDEELAAVLYNFEDLKMPDYCQRKKECDDMLDTNTDIPAEKCIGCLTDWLQSPAETEGTE
jgi:hypothetical protein